MYSDEDLARLLAKRDYALPLGHLSPSQVWSYISCPACFEAERILKIPRPVNVDLLIGLQTHRAVKHGRDLLMAGRLDPERPDSPKVVQECLDAGSDQFDGVLSAAAYEDKDEGGTPIPIEVELTKKYSDLDAAKDVGVNLTKVALPEILRYDLKAGVEAVEARVWHLGTPLQPEDAHTEYEAADYEAEALEQAEYDISPAFPFPVKAYLDVKYPAAIKDLKTSSRSGSPDKLASLQLLMYGLPWWSQGEPLDLGWDVAIKTKTPGFAAYWLRSEVNDTLRPGLVADEEYRYALWRVLRAAEGISAGRFDPNDGNLWCRFNHGLPSGERAITNVASWPGIAV